MKSLTPLHTALAAPLLAISISGCIPGSGCDPHSTVHTVLYTLPPVARSAPAFDAMVLDQGSHLLYLADRTDNGVDVIDTTSPDHRKYLMTVQVGSAPSGLALSSGEGLLFSGNSDNSVSLIDVKPGSPTLHKVLARVGVAGAKGVDLIGYDPVQHHVFAASPDDGLLSVVDALKRRVVATIRLAKGLEQPVFNPGDGMVYVADSDRNSIYRIDPHTDTVVREIQVGSDCSPTGIGIRGSTNQALVACDATQVLFWNPKTGDVFGKPTSGGGGDLVTYDAASDRFYVGGTSHVAIYNANPMSFFTNVQIPGNPHTAVYDELNKLVITVDEAKGDAGIVSFAAPAC